MKKMLLLGVLLIILVVLGVWLWPKYTTAPTVETPINQNPAQPSPAVNAHADLIVVANPVPNETVHSPLGISGQARGYWFFEASFPVELRDANGQLLAQGIAQATSDWMTESFVGFTASLTFSQPTTASGTLILRKDNPSGLPEHEDAVSIPVLFAQ